MFHLCKVTTRQVVNEQKPDSARLQITLKTPLHHLVKMENYID